MKKIAFLIVMLFCVQRFLANTIKIAEISNFSFEENKNFISQFVKPGDLVFDVGAHEGKKTQIYLALGAKVICFEPQPECVAILKNKFLGNNNVVIQEVGLGDCEKNLQFFKCSQASTISTFSYEYTQKGRFVDHDYKWERSVTLPITTLDKMIKKYGVPQFCKIDVENFEFEVLKGLSTPIKCISFECNTEWIENARKCIEHLESLGYKKFNFAVGERDWLLFTEWETGPYFYELLLLESQDPKWADCWGLWGDIYACM